MVEILGDGTEARKPDKFDRGASPKEVQHEKRRDGVVSEDTALEGGETFEQAYRPSDPIREG